MPDETSTRKKGRNSISLIAPTCAVLAAGLGWWLLSARGEVVGHSAVPGQIEVVLATGDELAFTADTDVLFDSPKRNAVPQSCMLDLTLVQGGKDVARTTCNLFKTSDAANFAATSNKSPLEGKTRLVITGQRLGCRFAVAATGPTTVKATSNVGMCVPKAYGVELEVRRIR